LIIFGDLRAGNGFRNQCEHWWRKHFLKSAGHPEIRENFRPAQFFLMRPKAAKRIRGA
jgi:hypothetical protein